MLGVAMFGGNSNRVRDVFRGGMPVVTEGRHPLAEDARAGFRAALKRLRSTP
jgi:hypothetical protein